MGFLGEVGSWVQVILGVGLLIFIHEAGHFLVAKWSKVRVEVFSLGFGPEMFGFTRGPTRYRVSIVPLGGYVKMSGETERPEGGYAPDDYPAQPVWRRALIIVAGVAMNAVLGFVLFAAALLFGLKVDPVVVGALLHGGPAWEAGIRPGDRLVAADGERLVAFPDLVYATMGGKPLELTVERAGRTLEVPVTPRRPEDGKTPGIGVYPDYGSVVGEVPAGGAAEKAGFRPGDRFTAIEGVPCTLSDLGDEIFRSAVLPPAGPVRVEVARGSERVTLTVPPGEEVRRIGIASFRDRVDLVRAGGPAERAGWKAGDRPVTVGGRPVRGSISFHRLAMGGVSPVVVARGIGEVSIELPADPAARLETLRDLRFADPGSPTAVEVFEGSPADLAGIPSGARILSVGGAPVVRFTDVMERIAAGKGAPVALEWAGTAAKGAVTVAPAPLAPVGLGALQLSTEPEGEILRASSPGEALSMAGSRCLLTTRQIVTTVAGIFGGSLDKDSLGGPILIAQVAHKSSKDGFGHFLWLLGMLSINLMFLNALPIPVLDGGQLALLFVESVTRRRPSEALVGITQMAGLVLLLGFMVFVTFNDVARLLR
jgi:regulator of sigma E protease